MPDKSIVIVGSESLLGKELRDLLSAGPLRSRLRLLGEEGAEAIFSSADDGATVITPLDAGNLNGAALLFLAGGNASSRRAMALAAGVEPRPAIVDVSRGLEDDAQARLRAPSAEPDGHQVEAGAINVVAHPAAIAVAMLLGRLQAARRIRRSVVQIFEPASERGQRGVEELQKQTVGLLSFQKLPQDVYDAQLSFNLLPRFGTEAPEPLCEVELRIERHLASLLAASHIPMPSLRLTQAPVFHGYSISAWVEFEESFDAPAAEAALACDQVEVRHADEEPATIAGAAGQSGLSVSVDADRNDPRALWFWVVTDNLRLAADNAVLVAAGLLGGAR